MAVDLFAGMPVSDFRASVAWYETLLGEGPAFFPHDTEAVWEVAEHCYLYVVQRAGAGHSVATVLVGTAADLGRLVEEVEARGLAPAEDETYGNGTRKVTYRDPDGNEIGFGGTPPGV